MITDSITYPPFKPHLPSWKHQEETLALSKSKPYYALFWEMGCGKSKALIDNAVWLYLQGEIDGVLILSDKGCYLSWEHEHLPKHIPPHIYTRVSTWKSYIRTKEQKRFNRVLAAENDMLDFLVMNIDAIATERGQTMAATFLRNHYALMAVDESSSIKNHKTARFAALCGLRDLAPYRRIMNGTPITQSPLDLYAQFEFLKPGALGIRTFTGFKSAFAVQREMTMGPRRFQVVVGFQNLDLLSRLIAPHSSRVLKATCLDLPDKVYVVENVAQTDEQERLYSQLRDEAMTSFNDNVMTVTSALTLVGKLHRINCGHIKTDDGIVRRIESNRIGALLDIVREVPGKVVIWTCFREDIHIITEALTEAYGVKSNVSYYGETSQADRQEALHRFVHDPECRFFVSTQSTGGKGINDLVVASTVVYYSNSFKLAERLQSEDRNHRPGQKSNVTYIDLVCPKTVDAKVIKALTSKKDIASMVVDNLRDLLEDDVPM